MMVRDEQEPTTHTAFLTAIEVSSIAALLVVKYALVVLHEVAQLLSQLQSGVLEGAGLRSMHHHCLGRLI